MSKREGDREDSPYSKRLKLSNNLQDVWTQTSSPQTSPSEVDSWKDLQRLLAFDQATGPRAHQNIQHLKSFLDLTAYSKDDEVKAAKRLLLHECLSHLPSQNRGLADLIRSWSFADKSNAERLFSAIAAVLALFLKVTSTHIEFRDYGNQLCQALLEEDNFRLFDRAFSAKKLKGHIISPCLRLLTQIVAYDGGAAAKLVWQRRHIAFLRLDIFLAMREEKPDGAKQSSHKPSVRDNALRYLFANLRLQSATAKAGILTLAHGKLARALFHGLGNDSPAIIVELFNVLQKHVITDMTLPRNAKKALFREEALTHIAKLYKYKEDPNVTESSVSVLQTTHTLLLCLCTSPESGLFETSEPSRAYGIDHATGEPNNSAQILRTPDGGTNTLSSTKSGRTLSNFLQGLRPHANLLEKELVLAVFKATPEVIVDYFQKKNYFPFEPKLTATWIGFANFLLSVMLLPIPTQYTQGLGLDSNEARIHANRLVETFFPPPLSQKSLTRCLNQSVDLITFLAVRIMTVAFQKFESLLNLLSVRYKDKGLSSESSRARTVACVVDRFRARCPEVRHVIAGFRRSRNRSSLQREAFSRLLVYYYRLVPQSAMEEKFDISVALCTAFLEYEALSNDILHTWELQNLLSIARFSQDMHWWHKPGSWEAPITLKERCAKCPSGNAPLSPFTTLLRLYCGETPLGRDDLSRYLLQQISEKNHILSCNKIPSIDLLSHSLLETQASIEIYHFLDNCFLQLVQKVVIYSERIASLKTQHSPKFKELQIESIDLLLIAIADQWPFLRRASNSAVVRSISRWLISYLDLSKDAGRNLESLYIIRDEILQSTEDATAQSMFAQALQSPSSKDTLEFFQSNKTWQDKADKLTEDSETASIPRHSEQELSLHLEPPEEDENHQVLIRWAKEITPDSVLEGTIGELTICLCSEHEDIRRQALDALRKIRKSLKVCPSWPFTETH